MAIYYHHLQCTPFFVSFLGNSSSLIIANFLHLEKKMKIICKFLHRQIQHLSSKKATTSYFTKQTYGVQRCNQHQGLLDISTRKEWNHQPYIKIKYHKENHHCEDLIYQNLPHATTLKSFHGLLEFPSHNSFQKMRMRPRVISETANKNKITS